MRTRTRARADAEDGAGARRKSTRRLGPDGRVATCTPMGRRRAFAPRSARRGGGG